MRYRTHFVSNSSSSSFVAIGRLVDKSEFGDNWREEDDWADRRIYVEEDDGNYLEGEVLADENNGNLPNVSLTLEQIQDKFRMAAVKNQCEIEEVKLYIVVRPC